MSRACSILALLLAAAPLKAGPVCALLDPAKTPQGALLEAKLLTDASATWVDRTNVDAILKEQMLQAAFGPQGVGDRVQLGKLLKADLLVLVRPVKDAKEPALEVVVSETAGGLRLLIRSVPITKDAGSDVAHLLESVRDGIKKHGEKIKEIIAVPPFVSNDLEFTFEHLKGAYAKLAEAEALDRPGVVVVELAEAEAVAKERALAAPGSKLERPLPLYLLGEYRHEGKGKAQQIAIKLRAERGGKPVGKPAMAASPSAVRTWAAETIDVVLADGKPRPPADPKAEAKLLAERTDVFQRLGNASETLALAEAGLLLDSDQPEMHAAALKSLSLILRPLTFRVRNGKGHPGDTVHWQRLYSRGLVHVEGFITRGGDPAATRGNSGGDIVRDFHIAGASLAFSPDEAQPIRDACRIMQDETRAMCLRVVPIMVKRGLQDHANYMAWAVQHLPLREKYDLLWQVIVQLQDLPGGADRADGYASQGLVSPPDTPEYRGLLARMAASENKDLQTAAARLNRRLEESKRTGGIMYATEPGRPKGPGPGGLILKPIAVTFERPDPTSRPPKPFLGLTEAGAGVDVVWTADALYLMKQKGKLRIVWRAPGDDDGRYGFSSVCFDGRYIWAALPIHQKNPVLLVIDPASEKVWDLSAAEGLPRGPDEELKQRPTAPTLMVTALESARACVAGQFLGRSWIGVATIDPVAGTGAVKLIHEAREVHNRADTTQPGRATVSFSPNLMSSVAGPPRADGKPTRRVLLGRGEGENMVVGQYFLTIDPDGPAVDALNIPVRWPVQGQSVAAGGALYLTELTADRITQVVRIGYPNPTRQVIAARLPPAEGKGSRILHHDGLLHVVLGQVEIRQEKGAAAARSTAIYQWWTVKPDGTAIRQVASDLPGFRDVAVSSHYGLAALVEREWNKPATLCAVEIGAPGSVLPSPEPMPTPKPVPKPKPIAWKHPEEEKGAKSESSKVETTISFLNKSGQPIRIYWLDFQGNRKLYGEIAAGKEFEQKTFISHAWVVTDADDNAWSVHRPDAKPQTIEIDAPKTK